MTCNRGAVDQNFALKHENTVHPVDPEYLYHRVYLKPLSVSVTFLSRFPGHILVLANCLISLTPEHGDPTGDIQVIASLPSAISICQYQFHVYRVSQLTHHCTTKDLLSEK